MRKMKRSNGFGTRRQQVSVAIKPPIAVFNGGVWDTVILAATESKAVIRTVGFTGRCVVALIVIGGRCVR